MKVAILGYSREGRAALEYFSNKGDVCTVFYYSNPQATADSPINHMPSSINTIEVPRETDYQGLLDDYDLVVRTADVLPTRINTTSPICSNTIEFFKQCPAPIIGVTGTKGKGTTSTLIAKFLGAAGHRVHLAGNIGQAPLEILPDIQPDDLVVLELSSYQLMDLTQSPHVAVHLMISPDHLDVHTDMAEYVHAKRNLFAHQGVDDIAVYTPLNAFSSQNVQVSPASTKIPYGAELKDVDGVRVVGEEILYGDAVVARLSDVALVGRHMLDNVCAAIAASWDYVPDKSIYPKVLRKFTGLPHRLQVVAEVNGVRYIDDSISTVPDTAMAAIRSFAEPKLLILGGSDKGNDYSDLAKLIAQDGTIKQVYLLGQTASKIAKSLQDADFDRYSDTHTELTEIVQQASKAAKQGDIVLLSPACASFDMFGSYAERGDIFSKAATDLNE